MTERAPKSRRSYMNRYFIAVEEKQQIYGVYFIDASRTRDLASFATLKTTTR